MDPRAYPQDPSGAPLAGPCRPRFWQPGHPAQDQYTNPEASLQFQPGHFHYSGALPGPQGLPTQPTSWPPAVPAQQCYNPTPPIYMGQHLPQPQQPGGELTQAARPPFAAYSSWLQSAPYQPQRWSQPGVAPDKAKPLPATLPLPHWQQHEPVQHANQQASHAQQRPMMFGQWQQLHREIVDFAARCVPTPHDLQGIEEAVEMVRHHATHLWPGSSTYLFGSQASGLSLPSSDLDLVILGAGPQMLSASQGFSKEGKEQVTARLRKLLKRLRACNLIDRGFVIGRARVPIIKCITLGGKHALDVSLGTSNGAAAVTLLRAQIELCPPLRPLALVIRALLKERGCSEVYTGGLSSYSIIWTIVAHLLQEGFQMADPGALGRHLPEHVLPAYYLLPQLPYAPQLDLGALLWGYLQRFSELRFNPEAEAVSVLQGGFISKPASWRNEVRPWLMSVEDPQDPGRDISAGSHLIREVLALFRQSADKLLEASVSTQSLAEGSNNHTDQRHSQTHLPDAAGIAPPANSVPDFPILSALLDVQKALAREQPTQVLNSPHEAKAHLTNRPASDHKSEVQVIRTGTPIKKLLTQPLTSKERRKLQRRRNELRKQIASLAGKDKLSRKESKRYNNAHRELGELDKEYGHEDPEPAKKQPHGRKRKLGAGVTSSADKPTLPHSRPAKAQAVGGMARQGKQKKRHTYRLRSRNEIAA